MAGITLISREEVRDAEGHLGTLYLVEKIPGIREAVLKNGSFRREDVGKSRTQVFTCGYQEFSDKMLAKIREDLLKGSIYETIRNMQDRKFDIIYFPN